MNWQFRGRCHLHALPGEDEDDVVGGEADEDAVGGALHLRPAQDEDGDEVAHQAQRPHAVQQDPRQEELEDKVLGRNSIKSSGLGILNILGFGYISATSNCLVGQY